MGQLCQLQPWAAVKMVGLSSVVEQPSRVRGARMGSAAPVPAGFPVMAVGPQKAVPYSSGTRLHFLPSPFCFCLQPHSLISPALCALLGCSVINVVLLYSNICTAVWNGSWHSCCIRSMALLLDLACHLQQLPMPHLAQVLQVGHPSFKSFNTGHCQGQVTRLDGLLA